MLSVFGRKGGLLDLNLLEKVLVSPKIIALSKELVRL